MRHNRVFSKYEYHKPPTVTSEILQIRTWTHRFDTVLNWFWHKKKRFSGYIYVTKKVITFVLENFTAHSEIVVGEGRGEVFVKWFNENHYEVASKFLGTGLLCPKKYMCNRDI